MSIKNEANCTPDQRIIKTLKVNKKQGNYTPESSNCMPLASISNYRSQRKKRRIMTVLRVLVSVIVVAFIGLLVSATKPVTTKNIDADPENNVESAEFIEIDYNDYESEYAQFALDLEDNVLIRANFPSNPLPLSEGQNNNFDAEQNEQRSLKINEQENQALEDEPIIEEVQRTANCNYPVVAIDGIIICAFSNQEDFEWTKKALLDAYSAPVAGGKPYSCGFFENIEILYQGSPMSVVTKEKALAILQSKLSVRLREKLDVRYYIPFKATYVDDPSMQAGEQIITAQGKKGIKTKTFEIVSRNGVEQSRKLTTEKVNENPINQVILRGTKSTQAINNKTNAVNEQEENNSKISALAVTPSKKVTAEVSQDDSEIVKRDQKDVIDRQTLIDDLIPEIADEQLANVSESEPVAQPQQETPAPSTNSTAKECFPGSTVGMGEFYPNIDTSKDTPGSDQGIKGPSSRSLSFAYPTSTTNISSNFGWRWGRMHYGVDYSAKSGDNCKASASGVISSYTGSHTGYGQIVEITHTGGFTTRYAHLSKISVSIGDKVSKGDIVGLVGDSGLTSGAAHLHFEIRHNGVPYNPRFYIN